MQVRLGSPEKWYGGGQCWSRGCACLGRQLLRGADLQAHLIGLSSPDETAEFMKQAGGFFSIIRQFANGEVIAAVDKARSIPLFFAEVDGEVVLSDSARTLAGSIAPAAPAPMAKLEFMQMGCVSGNETLHPQISQLRAGELLRCTLPAPTHRIERYFQYRQQPEPAATEATLLDEGEAAVSQAAANLAEYAGGRLLALPLSGGLDSTMLLAALRLAGYPQLLAFAYGKLHSAEVRASRAVATALGVAWRHVPYGPELWQRWFTSAERRGYYAAADNLCSLPHIQDFPALAELRRERLLPKDAVIASGISVEAFYGSPSQPPHPLQYSTQPADPQALAQMILEAKYRLWPPLYADPAVAAQLRARVLESIGALDFHPSSASAYESWFIHEKMTKFYANSVRCYEYWGHDWWLPLWDQPVIEFWQRVPPDLRRVRRFTERLVARLFRKAGGGTYHPLHFETPLLRGARLMRHAIQRLPLLRAVYSRLRRQLLYEVDSLGWLELFDRATVLTHYHPKLTINALLVKEYFGELRVLTEERATRRA